MPERNRPHDDALSARDHMTVQEWMLCTLGFRDQFAALNDKLDRITCLLERLMLTAAQMNTELIAANAKTNEIAADVAEVTTDVADLVAKANAAGTPAEHAAVEAELATLKANLAKVGTDLKAVAATHTPGSTV